MLPYQTLRVYPWGWIKLRYVLESPDQQVHMHIGTSWYDHLVAHEGRKKLRNHNVQITAGEV